MANYLIFDGDSYATAPTLGNLLTPSSIRIVSENVTWASLTGYLWSQAASGNRELGLWRSGTDLQIYFGGSNFTLMTGAAVSTEFGSSTVSGQIELLIETSNNAQYDFTLKRSGVTIATLTNVSPLLSRTDGCLFRLGARAADEISGSTTGAYFIGANDEVGDTDIYIDGVLVRRYVMPSTGTTIPDTQNNQDATLRQSAGDDSEWGSTGASGPTLSSVPATAFPGQSRTVTGTGFGATQGTGGLTIGGVSQTITSWSDTSITFTTVLGTNSYGTGKTLEVTTDAAATVSDTIELVADTAGAFGYVVMSSPNTSDESSVAFGATPTVATGDQFEWEDFNALGNLVIDAQGFVESVDAEGTFRGRFWDATDSTWGAVESFNATIPESPPAFAPTVGTITKDDTTASIPFTYVGGDADSFEYSTDAGGTWTTTTSPISLSGLTAETSYSGLVRAVNTGGNGPTASFSFTTNAVGVVDNWPFGKGIEYAATQNWEWGKRHPKTGMRVRVYK